MWRSSFFDDPRAVNDNEVTVNGAQSRCYVPCVCPEERFNSSTGIVRMPAVCFA
jgi:hypothetical protein